MTFQGYAFGTGDYAVSRMDPANRVGGDVDLSASTANNFVVGENITNDLIIGGFGNDLIFGGTGIDTLVGGAGSDLLVGDTGTDLLVGGAGQDVLVGGSDGDILDGGIDNDVLNGGDGNDTVIGGSGDDTIDVSSGNDFVAYTTVDFGADIVNGFDADPGAGGQDLIDVSALGIDAGNFAAMVTITDLGSDTLVSFGGGSVRFNGVSGVGANTITSADFALSTVGNPITGDNTGQTHNGTPNRDTINALGGGDLVNGNGGNDTIVGGTGNDTLNGNDGNDTFIWNASGPDGRDLVNGGTETSLGDIFVVNGDATSEAYSIYTRPAWIALGGGNTTLNASAEIVVTRNGTNNAAIIAELSEIEEIRINGIDPSEPGGLAGNDTFTIVGDFSATNLRPNTITIVGGGGGDSVNVAGMTGANVVFQSAGGNSTVVDKGGAIGVAENAAAGTVVYTPTETTVAKGTAAAIHSLAGKDAALFSIDSQTGEVKFLASPDFEKPGDDGGDNVYDIKVVTQTGSLTTERDVSIAVTDVDGATVKGTKKADTIGSGLSTGEADVIDGKKGNDKLFGLAGDDTIKGAAGKDRIDGGADDDLLIGGAGKDTFVFATGYGNDRVEGYKAGEDSFDLSGTGVGGFKDLKSLMTEAGGSVLINFNNGDTLSILNTTIKKLGQNQNDFDFA